MIEGRIQTRTWTDPNNNKRYFTEVVAEGLQLGPRMASAESGAVSDVNPRSNLNNSRPPNSNQNKDDDIPIIDANDPISSGVEEDEVKIKEEDLPF